VKTAVDHNSLPVKTLKKAETGPNLADVWCYSQVLSSIENTARVSHFGQLKELFSGSSSVIISS